MAQSFPAAVPNTNEDALYTGSVPSTHGSVQSSALPEPSASRQPSHVGSARNGAAPGWSGQKGTRVALRQGETLYTLSRRYGVPADAIMKANGISDASEVAAGREVLIPTYNYGSSAPVSAPDNDPQTRNASASPASRPDPGAARQASTLSQQADRLPRHDTMPPAANDSSPSGQYVVQSGDTLTRIAGRTGVSIDALKHANNLSGSAIRVGQRLDLPRGGSASAKAAPTQAVTTASVPSQSSEPEQAARNDEAGQKTASAEPTPKAYTPPESKTESVSQAQAGTEVATAAPESSGIGKLRWPLHGQVVSKFGSEANGGRNDGIDVSVPSGSAVKAAENGVVIYAGNGLKEYGNTVLIRHDDGLVTVYGYAKDLKVSRGDKVTRGEVIADSGMSGAASRPTLHFEVRKDAKPVDPMAYLD